MKTFKIRLNGAENLIVVVDNKNGRLVQGFRKSASMDMEDCAYNASLNVIESMVLAHACAGIDISLAAYVEGIVTALDAIVTTWITENKVKKVFDK